MERVCLLGQVRPERLDEYREAHRAVWPEMRDALTSTGWHNYSLFLDGTGLLVGYLETDDYAGAADAMARTEVNARWQQHMRPLFTDPDDRPPDQQFLRIPEVFHLD